MNMGKLHIINDVDIKVSGTILSNIVGAYKSIVANLCFQLYKIKGQQMG